MADSINAGRLTASESFARLLGKSFPVKYHTKWVVVIDEESRKWNDVTLFIYPQWAFYNFLVH